MHKTALLMSLVLLSVVAYAQERIALVVGNAAYEHTSQLSNPVNDASDIAATLENLGFSESRLYDASRDDIQKAVDEFANRAKKPGTQVALFYYSGHGVEYEGVNYVIPVNAQIENEYQLLDQGMSMDRVTRALDRGRAEFNMVVLDACRDNPFFKTKSGGGRGLAVMSGSGKGSVIAFATSPGEVAQDGSGRNSPFTKAFVKNADVPGLEVSTLMRQVVGDVEKSTKGRQKPWFNVSYTGDVYLSAAEDLTGATARVAGINREIATLEAEIAKRQQAINAARNQEEKIRLEVEQRRAKADESDKRLAATQLASIKEQTRRVLEQRKSEEALRNQMEKQLEIERVNLSQKAQERRVQLAALVGEITYKVQEEIPDLWLLNPGTGRMLNLLEKDAVLTRATRGRGMVVRTAGEMEVLESGMGQVELRVNDKNVGKTSYMHTSPAGKTGTSRVEYRWEGGEKRVVSVAPEGGMNNTVRAFPDKIERLATLRDSDLKTTSPATYSKVRSGRPTFRWSFVRDADGYELQIAETRNTVAKTDPVPVTGTAYTPKEALPNGKISWRVRALRADGSAGQWSAISEVTVEWDFVHVEGGSFQMGSTAGDDDEKPVHTVRVDSFYMGKYEVTQEEWQEVMGSNPSRFKGTNRPVEGVSWYDVVAYCNKRSYREGRTPVYQINGERVRASWTADGYRLPTEAEWEYAARGGNESRGYEYAGGDNADQVGWYGDNSGDKTQPVGGKSPNELGIYDMSGNVWEWCWDRYGGYSYGSQTNPKGASSGPRRVLRGGSWYLYAGYLRSAYRHVSSPDYSSSNLGFRLVVRTP